MTDDVGCQLGEHAVTLRGPLARSSLRLSVVPDLGPIGRYAWVADALDTMPADERLCFVLRNLEGYRLEEVAIMAGMSLATVKRKLAKADARVAQVSAEDGR